MKSIIKAIAFTNAPVSAACQGLRRKGYINCTCVVRGNVVAMTMESQPTNYIYIYIYIYVHVYAYIWICTVRGVLAMTEESPPTNYIYTITHTHTHRWICMECGVLGISCDP